MTVLVMGRMSSAMSSFARERCPASPTAFRWVWRCSSAAGSRRGHGCGRPRPLLAPRRPPERVLGSMARQAGLSLRWPRWRWHARPRGDRR